MIRVIMHGCNGRMGQTITGILENDTEARIVAGVDMTDCRDNGYPVFTSLKDCQTEADVVIDFASAKAVDGLLDYCVERKLPVVLCTTGLSNEQLLHVEEASKEIAVLRSGNMSLGINTIQKLIAEAAKVLAPAGFDVEIVEKHHNQKLDAPSGTAIMLADSVNEALGKEYHYVYDRSQVRQVRDEKEIGICAVRGGSIVGDHDVIFAGKDEVITISHRAYSRAIFGNGAVLAAKFLAGKKPGYYNMGHVIEER